MLKFRPRMYTSYRSHGKWGDFLACIVPAIWCINILTNSSFIMRLLEWQYELSLFSVRVRGRQWYWVYKFDFSQIIEIATIPFKVGRTKWFVSIGGFLFSTHDYLHALFIRAHDIMIKSYWDNTLVPMIKLMCDPRYTLLTSKTKLEKKIVWAIDDYNYTFNAIKASNLIKNSVNPMYPYNSSDSQSILMRTNLLVHSDVQKNNRFINLNLQRRLIYTHLTSARYIAGRQLLSLSGHFELWFSFYKKETTYIDQSGNIVSFYPGNRQLRRVSSDFDNLLLSGETNSTTTTQALNSSTSQLTDLSFNKTSYFTEKTNVVNNGLVIKQKRAKSVNLIPIKILAEDLDPLVAIKRNFATQIPTLNMSGALRALQIHVTSAYKHLGRSRKRAEVMSVQLSRRLLRTQRTLVLPAQANLTLITNSYDVVHSWFLPSLGLKMDCVPGRSTHHTFYVDSMGFFYGQCAEICGRYHHHMPIRLCTLSFEHFLVWWHHFGIPKLFNLSHQLQEELHKVPSRFSW